MVFNCVLLSSRIFLYNTSVLIYNCVCMCVYACVRVTVSIQSVIIGIDYTWPTCSSKSGPIKVYVCMLQDYDLWFIDVLPEFVGISI